MNKIKTSDVLKLLHKTKEGRAWIITHPEVQKQEFWSNKFGETIPANSTKNVLKLKHLAGERDS